MGAGGSKKVRTPEGFNIDIWNALSSDTRNQLEKYAENQENCIDELKERHDKLKVDSEQRHFEIEKQLISTNEKLETETKNASEFRIQLVDIEKKYNEAAGQARQSQLQLFETEKRSSELEQHNRQLSGEKNDLSTAVDKKTQEIDTLTTEWKQMSQKVADITNTKIQCQAKLDEIQSHSITAQHREDRRRQENDGLQQQNDWFQAEIREKTQQLLSARKDQAATILQLQAQLDEKSTELSHVQQLVDSLKHSAEEQNDKIETYIHKLRDARDSQVQVEEQYKMELQSQEKLANIYKKSAEDQAKQASSLMPEVDKLHNLLKSAASDQADLIKEKEAETGQWQATVQDRDDQIIRMNKELEDANELIAAMKKKGILAPTEENIEALSPAASTASRLLKSGMTLTQIYSEYIQSTEALHLEQEENNRLKQYLDQILQEIEEKAPILKKQREDYENSLESISQLTAQLDAALTECEKLRVGHDESERISRELTRENKRLQQTASDLSRQVRMLLKELEEARGTVVSMSYDTEISSADVSSSSHVISENLVTFKSIEELQGQNQRLLVVIRDLSEQKEKEELESGETKISKLKKQLDEAVSAVQELQAARQRQADMVESVIRQRDMYKLMLNTSVSSPVSMMSPQQQTPIPHIASTPLTHSTPAPAPQSPADDKYKLSFDEKCNELKELQKDFSGYRKERTENEKILNEQLDKYRLESSNMRVLNAKLSSQLDFSAERFKVLQSNVDAYKLEIAALRDKAQKLSANNAKYEETNATYRIELMTSQEKLAHAEAQSQNLRVERDMLKSIEHRLLQEKESSYKDQLSRDQLMANIQSIQNNLERSEFETKAKLGKKIDLLEKENSIIRRKLEGVTEEHNRRGAALEKQLAETRSDLDKDRSVLQANREQLRLAADELVQLKKELSAAEAKLTSLPQKEMVQKTAVQDMRQAGELKKQAEEIKKKTEELKTQSEKLKDLNDQLNTANNEIRGLKSQLDDSVKKADQYKSIAHSVEENLEEQNKASKELELNVTTQLEEAKKARAQLESQMESLEQANEELVDENQVLSVENEKLINETSMSTSGQQKRFEALQRDFGRLQGERDEAIRKQDVIKQDLEHQIQLANEAQEKYQHELMLHAADVSQLTTVKAEVKIAIDKLSAAQDETLATQKILEAKQTSWNSRESILKTDHAKLETRTRELQNQNRLLHEELENLSGQMVCLQQKSEADDHEHKSLAQAVVEEGENRSSEQLLEVIRFLRKEKDIAEAQLDGLKAENTRLKHQLEYDHRQLDEANRSLDETKQREQVSIETAVKHAELMKKVETLNLLQDSNRLMREEKDSANNTIKQLQDKVKELEAEITPLQDAKMLLQNLYESLQVERNALQGEVMRWKNRTNQLIEQCNKADPEEFKRLLHERDLLKSQLTAANEELHKLRAEFSKANNQNTQLQSEIKLSKLTVQKLNEELVGLKITSEVNDKKLAELNSKLNQVRLVGRKYRQQAEAVQAQLDKHLAENSLQKLEETHKAKMAELEAKIKKTEAELACITEDLAVAESEKNTALKSLASTESEKNNALKAASVAETEKANALKTSTVHETNASKYIEQLKTINEELNKEKTDSLKEKEVTIKLREECIEAKKKSSKTIQILGTAKEKISSQMKEIERLSNESKSINEKINMAEQKNTEYEAQAAALKSQYEARMSSIQKDLAMKQSQSATATDTAELEKLKKDNTDLTQKLQQVQKQLEAQLKQISPTVSSRPTVTAVERPGTSTESVKTANIKPMTTPTTSSRPIQSAMVQPVRSTPTESRIRASVQPMAVSTITTASTQSTPTATVMPSLQDSETTQQVAPLSQMSPQHVQQQQVRPTQQVQPVSHVEEIPEVEPEVIVEAEPVVVLAQPVPTTITVHAQPTAQVISTSQPTAHVVSTQQSIAQVVSTQQSIAQVVSMPQSAAQVVTTSQPTAQVVSVPQPTVQVIAQVTGSGSQLTSTPSLIATAAVVPSQSTQADDAVGSSAQAPMAYSAKRPRDEAESSDDQSITVKRTKTQSPAVAEPPVPVNDELELELLPIEPSEDNLVLEDSVVQEQQMATVAPTPHEVDTHDIEPEVELFEEEEDSYEDQVELEEEDTRDSLMAEGGQGEAIVLTSDEEDDEYEGEMEEYEDEDGEGMHEIYDEEDEEEEEDGMEDIMEEPMHEEGEDDDVIVVDEDEVEPSPEEVSMEPPLEEPQSGQSQPDRQAVPQVPVIPRSVPQLSRVPSQTDRLIPAVRAQQLTPFTFGEGSAFEVGDDGIVPSTPTLLVPRRHDDFAQTVSSPQTQRRFVFGASSEVGIQNPEFGRLETQGALGVDDIRMDLTQFDEASGSGRSVPVTPVSQTPPTISITEPSPPPEEGAAVTTQQPQGHSEGHVSPEVLQQGEQETTAMSQQGEYSQESTSQAEAQAEDLEKGQGEGTDAPAPDEPDDEQDDEAADRAGTSDSQDRTDQTGSNQSKPRIQRIVWDKPSTSGSPIPQLGTTPPVQITHASPSQVSHPPGQQRKVRGQGRGYRMQRPMQREVLQIGQPGLPQQPGHVMGPRIPGQHRGTRGTRMPKRGQFHQQQHHRQPPF